MNYRIKDVLDDPMGLSAKLAFQYGTAGAPYRNAMRKVCQQISEDNVIHFDEIDRLDCDTLLSQEATVLFFKAQEIRRDTLERMVMNQRHAHDN